MLFVGRTRRLHKTGIGGVIMNKSEIEQLRGLVIERVDMSREPDDSELHEIIDSVIEKNQDYRYMSIKKRQIIHQKNIFLN